MVVVDRSQSDEVKSLILGWDARVSEAVRYVRPATPCGAGAWAAAVRAIESDHVAVLNSCDELLPLATEYYTHSFRRNAWADACYGRAVRRDELGRLIPSKEGCRPDGRILDWLASTSNAIARSAFACKRAMFLLCPVTGDYPNLEWLEFLFLAAQRAEFHCVQEDVVIVESPEAEPSPIEASGRCKLLEALGGSARGCSRRFDEHLASCEYTAAVLWWKAGQAERARNHARTAASLVPWNPRYLLLAGLTEADRLLPRWISSRRAA